MNGIFMGLDIGSTSLTAILIDVNNKNLLGVRSCPNKFEITNISDRKKGRSEWDLQNMVKEVLSIASDLIKETGVIPEGIGVTGQQQGVQLIDNNEQLQGPFISWQDQRLKEQTDGISYLEKIGKIGGAEIRQPEGLYSFEKAGCPLVTGYTAPTLFWLDRNFGIPENYRAITAPEMAVSMITESSPVIDPTNALGWGVFDVYSRQWQYPLIEKLGLNKRLFPPIIDSCSLVGNLSKTSGNILGLSPDIPVTVASGDHQCSFAGTVANINETVAINIGTGGQVSMYLTHPLNRGSLELRPYLDDGYFLAGVGTIGGRTFRNIRDFFQGIVKDIAGINLESDSLYSKLVELAETVPKNSNGVTWRPFFTGSRTDPMDLGQISGLSPSTLTSGHLVRALFEAMAEHLFSCYKEALDLGVVPRDYIVGTGNGLKRNKVLRDSIEQAFGMKIQITRHDEEAGIGAAMCSAVAGGVYSSIQNASEKFLTKV
jgi:sedoheptulokinase